MSAIAGYCRVSTQRQMDFGVSLPDQENRIKQRYPTATVYKDEGVSASKNSMEQRPASALLLRSVESGETKTVVCTSLSRLFRSTAECLITVKRWNKMGVTFVCLDLDLDTSKPMGFMVLSVIAACAELEASLIGERTKAAMTHLKTSNPSGWTSKKSGRQVPGFGGPAYDSTGPAVQWAARLHAQGLTHAEVAQAMNSDEAAPRPARKPLWTPRAVGNLLWRHKP